MSVPELSAWYADATAASCLEILSDEGFRPEDLLDPVTLSAVASAAESNHKFKRARPELYEAPEETPPPKFDNWEDSGDDVDVSGVEDKHNARKTGKANSNAAARSKACREKARRERINERFVELATLLDRGKEPKIDKSSILGDAIKAFKQLLAENNQLKQLNKFLEERVGQLEKVQGQQLYQHALYQAQSGQVMQSRTHSGSSSSCLQPLVTGVPCMQPGSIPSAVNVPSRSCELPPSLLQQQLILQDRHTSPFASAVPTGHTPQGLMPGKATLLAGVLNQQGELQSLPLPYLLSSSNMDHWQDSLLRPPAA